MFLSREDYLLDLEEVPAPLVYRPLERGLISSLSSLVFLGRRRLFLSTLGDLGLAGDVLLLLVLQVWDGCSVHGPWWCAS